MFNFSTALHLPGFCHLPSEGSVLHDHLHVGEINLLSNFCCSCKSCFGSLGSFLISVQELHCRDCQNISLYIPAISYKCLFFLFFCNSLSYLLNGQQCSLCNFIKIMLSIFPHIPCNFFTSASSRSLSTITCIVLHISATP